MTSQEKCLARSLRREHLRRAALLGLFLCQLPTCHVLAVGDSTDPYRTLSDVLITLDRKDGKSYVENESTPSSYPYSDSPFGVKNILRTDDAALSPYEAILRDHGIKPDVNGLGKYLRQLHPDEDRRREVRKWIEQLGSDRYGDRESAMRRLLALPIPPTEALRIASESGDEEVSFRARTILDQVKPRRMVQTVLMHAIFKTIQTNKVQGLTGELLRAVELCEQPHLLLSARAAVRATARPGDAPLLRKATRDDNNEVVIAAIGGLGAALGTNARDDLRHFLEHKTETFRFAAARALADQGDRMSLGPLVKLLGSTSLEVRVDAVKTLRQLSHTHQKYAAYEDEPARREAIGRWTAWVMSKGRTAKLHIPLKGVRIEMGRTLISIPGQNRVIELDAKGKQVWEKTGLNHPWAGMGMPNGHRLISSEGGCIEYDASGKEVWRKNGPSENPHDSRRLENGNTLIACYGSKEVVEIRPDGSTAWEISINGGPVELRRLNSGRTLVTLYSGGRVVEVNHAGKVHWEIKGLNKPMTAQRLENGNTLVAEHGGGQVAEWDRDGKIVWQYRGLRHAYSAERLANGNTLIACRSDVREVDCWGNIVWEKKMTGLYHAIRY